MVSKQLMSAAPTSPDSTTMGLYEKVKYASSTEPWRSTRRRRSSKYTVSPRKTRSKRGAISPLISAQLHSTERPSPAGCLSPMMTR